MARHLKPGDRVARPQLDRTIHGEVITYNGELRVLREDTKEMDLTVGWYVLDRDTGCGDATCTTCAAPKLPAPTVGLEAATTLAQLALAGLERPITVHTLAWRESGAEDPEDAGGELQPGLVVVRGSDEPIRLRLDVDTLRPLSDHAEVLTPVGVSLKPLDVKPDSVIVVSMPKDSPVQMLDQFSLFSKALKKRLGDGVLVVGVEQNTSIDVLADQLLPLGRAILPQEEVLRLQGRDTRAALLEDALWEWLDARTPGRLPRDTAEWTAHLGRQLDADATLEREVRRLGVGPGREVVERPERRALPEFVTLPVDPVNVVRDLCELLAHAETNFGARPGLDMVAFTLPPTLYQRAAQEVAEQSRFGPDPLPGSEWPVARPSEAACYVIRNVDLYQDDDAQEVRLWLAVRGVEQAFPHARWTSRHGSGGFATGGTIPRGTPLPAGFPTLGDPAPSRLSPAQLREMQAFPEPTYGYHPDEDQPSMTPQQLTLAYRLSADAWIAERLGVGEHDPETFEGQRSPAGVLVTVDGDALLPDLADPTGATEGVLRQALREQPGMINARTRYSRSKGGWVVNVDVTERTQPLSYPTEVEAIGHQLLERRAFVRLLPQPIPPGPVPGIPVVEPPAMPEDTVALVELAPVPEELRLVEQTRPFVVTHVALVANPPDPNCVLNAPVEERIGLDQGLTSWGRSYTVTVALRGFPESTDALADRVRRTLETHPTLSLRVDEVVAKEALPPGVSTYLVLGQYPEEGDCVLVQAKDEDEARKLGRVELKYTVDDDPNYADMDDSEFRVERFEDWQVQAWKGGWSMPVTVIPEPEDVAKAQEDAAAKLADLLEEEAAAQPPIPGSVEVRLLGTPFALPSIVRQTASRIVYPDGTMPKDRHPGVPCESIVSVWDNEIRVEGVQSSAGMAATAIYNALTEHFGRRHDHDAPRRLQGRPFGQTISTRPTRQAVEVLGNPDATEPQVIDTIALLMRERWEYSSIMQALDATGSEEYTALLGWLKANAAQHPA